MVRKPRSGFRSQDLVTSFMRNRTNTIKQLLLWSRKKTSFFPFFSPFFCEHALLAAARKSGVVDHQNYSAKRSICTLMSPMPSGFRGVLGFFLFKNWTAEGAKPQEGAHPGPGALGIPWIPRWKFRSSPSALAGAPRAAGSLWPGVRTWDVSALPAPSTTSSFVDQSRLLPAKLFSLWCAVGTQCYLGNLKPRFVIRMLQGQVTKLKGSTWSQRAEHKHLPPLMPATNMTQPLRN